MIKKTIKNERGFVLIVSMLMLLVLMIIGIAATNTTTIELQISGNDKVSKQTFYQADSGTEAGIRVVEDCIEESGFDGTSWYGVTIGNANLYMNDALPSSVDASLTQGSEVTNLKFVAGATHTTPGSGSQMAAGYEVKVKVQQAVVPLKYMIFNHSTKELLIVKLLCGFNGDICCNLY